MNTYRHVKTVQADKIAEVAAVEGGGLITLEDGSTHSVEARWLVNHSPRVGGYLCQLLPGKYVYWPADRFEATYVVLPTPD